MTSHKMEAISRFALLQLELDDLRYKSILVLSTEQFSFLLLETFISDRTHFEQESNDASLYFFEVVVSSQSTC